MRDRLTALLEKLEANLKTNTIEIKQLKSELAPDEVFVYVYLFNAQGLTLQSWHPMLARKVFYEYSVNRPIYSDKAHIESLVRSKANQAQHAYLTVAIKKVDIQPSSEAQKDSLGHPLLKIKEGSLQLEKLSAFTHSNQDYALDEFGRLVRKPT